MSFTAYLNPLSPKISFGLRPAVAFAIALPFFYSRVIPKQERSFDRHFTLITISFVSFITVYHFERTAWGVHMAVLALLKGYQWCQGEPKTEQNDREAIEQNKAIEGSVNFSKTLPELSTDIPGLWPLKNVKENMKNWNPTDGMDGSSKDTTEFFYSTLDKGPIAQNQLALPTGSSVLPRVKRDFAPFSNTYSGEVFYDGYRWQSREHAFQAQKFKKGSSTYMAIQRAEGCFCSAGSLRSQVKGGNCARDLRVTDWKNWNEKEKIPIMMELNYRFFSRHPDSRELLLDTCCGPLVEHNRYPDEWGISFERPDESFNKEGSPVNLNYQGEILMRVRWKLQQEAGALYKILQGAKNSFVAWADVPEADQAPVYRKLTEFALAGDKREWSDDQVKGRLKEGFQLKSWHWSLSGSELIATREGEKTTIDMSKVSVAHMPSIPADDVEKFLKREDVQDRVKRGKSGNNLAIRGQIAPQFRIANKDKTQGVEELSTLTPVSMIWACWPDASSAKNLEGLAEYRAEVTKTLNLLDRLASKEEVISIVVPRAFMPQKQEATAKNDSKQKEMFPLYYGYRKAFIETVNEFANEKLRSVVLHALQDNEWKVVQGLSLGGNSFLTIAPIGADIAATTERLTAKGKDVVFMCTGNSVGHIGNVANQNKGGWALDERLARTAMCSYLAVFSGIVNPALCNRENFHCVN